MPLSQQTTGVPTFGLSPEEIIRIVYNRTGSAVVVGDVAMLDTVAGDGDVTTHAPGASTSVYANAIAPGDDTTADLGAAAAVSHAYYGVWQKAGADNDPLPMLFKGITKVMVQRSAGSGSVTPGLPLVVTTAEDLNATIATGLGVTQRVLGIFRQAATTISTRVLADVEFDGISYRTVVVKATG